MIYKPKNLTRGLPTRRFSEFRLTRVSMTVMLSMPCSLSKTQLLEASMVVSPSRELHKMVGYGWLMPRNC